MFNFSKSKKAIATVVTAATLILALSFFAPTVFSQTSNSSSTLPVTIDTYGNAWDGIIAFDLSNPSTLNASVVMDTNGTVVNMRQSTTAYQGATYNIAPDTILFEGEPSVVPTGTAWALCATHFWNFVTNTTDDFPNVQSDHDIQYNPVNNTFLTLQDYTRQVGNNLLLLDKILQVDANGNVLWTWDTYDYIPLSEMSPFNETVTLHGTGQTAEDATHANSLDWDYNNSIIYLNLRITNTFYKIDQNTGNIIWACGEFGNFTLLGSDGSPVSSLWYHSHDTKQVAPGVFTMFDNDFENNTNPNDCHSQLLELTLNETSMTAYASWSWEAPTKYWNTYGGATVILPNGDYLGAFGDPTHQFTQNQPWNFNNTGAVLIEVNRAGQVVRTWTFPVGWYIYRVEAVTDLTSAASPTPTATTVGDQTPTNGLAIATAAVIVIVVVTVVSLLYWKRQAAKKGL